MKKLRCIVPLVLLFCLTIACQDKAAMAELEKYKAQAMVEEQNRVLLKRTWDTWNKGDFEAWKQMHADEYAYYSPSYSTKPMSREETIEMGKAFFKSFPDAKTSVEELIAVGDNVITRWILRGTQKGEFAGIPATGNKVETSGIMITRIVNGKIVEDREDYDVLGMMTQLGMELKPMPTPSEPAKTTEAMLPDLRDAHKAWFEGLLAEDTKILNKVLSEEVTLGFPGGNTMPRAEFLSLLQSGELFYDTAEHESVGFQIYGNTAVATGRSNLTYRYKGAKDFERLSYTAVYVRTNGEWKMVAWQSTRRPN